MQIEHQNDGKHNLVCWKAEEKSGKDTAIQPHELTEGLKCVCDKGEQASVGNVEVSSKPEDESSWSSDNSGSSKDEEGAVEKRADEDLGELGSPIGGKFQREGGR